MPDESIAAMKSQIHRIHHVTALADHGRAGADLYAGVLDLRPAERTTHSSTIEQQLEPITSPAGDHLELEP